MTLSRRAFLRLTGVSAAATAVGLTIEWSGAKSVAEASPALHLVNRITWGARPQDLEQVRVLGLEAYLEAQLAPETLADTQVEAFLEAHSIFGMSEAALRDHTRSNYGEVFRLAVWGRLFRAIHSERQLYERMVEFWTDHFNVPIGDLIPEKMVDDREVIRRYAFRSFRELLFASAQSPAMLLYLSNASSHKDHPNENYARELLELHTLGVDAPYSEDDVQAVARAFTGWTLREGWPGRFFFDRDKHDSAEKVVLGQPLGADRGIEDGLQVLDLLATHPATARHISSKLCRFFVSDVPPPELIDSTTQVFLSTQGDVRSLLRHILSSEAFYAAEGQKLRRPVDFVVASLRVLGSAFTLDEPNLLFNWLEPLGQLPYMWQPPDGYPDTAAAWINTNALMHRWNFALLLPRAGAEWFEAGDIDLAALIPVVADESVGQLIDRCAQRLLGGPVATRDREQLVFFVSDYGDELQRVDTALREERLPALLGLLMASPYFQWR